MARLSRPKIVRELFWGGIGAAAGLTAAAALSRLMSSLLFEIAAAAVASYFPLVE